MKQIAEIPKLPARKPESHKGTYGKVLVIGGSIGMSGAPSLVGKAALRAGSGLVRLAVGESVLPVIAGLEPCYTSIMLAEDNTGKISEESLGTILESVVENDAVAFGPGCGVGEGVCKILEKLLTLDLNLVLDADGLNNLCKVYNWWENLKADVVLTPHPGEMSRLWKSVFREDMPDDRVETAVKFSNKTNTVTVLKGHETVVAKKENYYINKTGNPGMATAGSGDVLTGMILSLFGQGLCSFDAAVLGVYEHGVAGDKAAKQRSERSMVATDIIENIL